MMITYTLFYRLKELKYLSKWPYLLNSMMVKQKFVVISLFYKNSPPKMSNLEHIRLTLEIS